MVQNWQKWPNFVNNLAIWPILKPQNNFLIAKSYLKSKITPIQVFLRKKVFEKILKIFRKFFHHGYMTHDLWPDHQKKFFKKFFRKNFFTIYQNFLWKLYFYKSYRLLVKTDKNIQYSSRNGHFNFPKCSFYTIKWHIFKSKMAIFSLNKRF